jgi:hypothetical protein
VRIVTDHDRLRSVGSVEVDRRDEHCQNHAVPTITAPEHVEFDEQELGIDYVLTYRNQAKNCRHIQKDGYFIVQKVIVNQRVVPKSNNLTEQNIENCDFC